MQDIRNIDAATIRSTVRYGDLLDSLQQAHTRPPAIAKDLFIFDGELGDGEGRNCFAARAAWEPGRYVGCKSFTVFPGNGASTSELPTTQASYDLWSGVDGRQLARIDGKTLTNMKTAADSALGARFLARRDAEVLLMVGAGSLAPDLVEAHLESRPSVSRVLIANRTASKAYALKQLLEDRKLAVDEIVVVDSVEEGARQADIISCATAAPAHAPILCGAWLKPGTHVDLVGAYSIDMRESDDEVMRRGSIFVDSRRTTIGDVGDIQIPLHSGVITEADIQADLYDLSVGRHRGRTNPDEITVIKIGGGGHLDLMTAVAIWEKTQV